ncbi:MAG: DUF5711 family protein [Saccharofermentanales bacterium]
MRSGDATTGRQKTGLYVLIVLAAVLMALSVVLIVGFPQEDYVRPSSASGETFSQVNGFDCDLNEARKLYPLGNGLLKLGRDMVSYVDYEGNEKFSESIVMETPACHIGGEYALIMDLTGTSFALINTDGVVYKEQTPYTIDYGNVSDQGYAAVLFDKPGLKGVVRFLAPDGSRLFEWESVESGFIVSARISGEINRADAVVYNTDGAQPYPIMRRFSLNGESVAQFYPETDEILTSIIYNTSDEPVLFGGSSIIKPGNNGFEIRFNKIYAAAETQYGIIFIARRDIDDTPMMYKLSDDGTLGTGILMSEEITGLTVNSENAAAGLGNTVLYIDIKQMRILSGISVEASLIRIGFNAAGDKLVVVSTEGIKSYKVK